MTFKIIIAVALLSFCLGWPACRAFDHNGNVESKVMPQTPKALKDKPEQIKKDCLPQKKKK